MVEEVAQNTIIRGTKEYNKDEYISGAIALTSTPVFPEWQEGGKVFYKVRKQALDPRNFKDGGDVGTLAVRYVVQTQGDRNTVLRIDARCLSRIFGAASILRTARWKAASTRTSRTNSEEWSRVKKETAEALLMKQERLAKENFGLGNDSVVLDTSSSQAPLAESASGNANANRSPSPAPPQHHPDHNHRQRRPRFRDRHRQYQRRMTCLMNRWNNTLPSCASRSNGW